MRNVGRVKYGSHRSSDESGGSRIVCVLSSGTSGDTWPRQQCRHAVARVSFDLGADVGDSDVCVGPLFPEERPQRARQLSLSRFAADAHGAFYSDCLFPALIPMI